MIFIAPDITSRHAFSVSPKEPATDVRRGRGTDVFLAVAGTECPGVDTGVIAVPDPGKVDSGDEEVLCVGTVVANADAPACVGLTSDPSTKVFCEYV
jgi:hypothetical protein